MQHRLFSLESILFSVLIACTLFAEEVHEVVHQELHPAFAGLKLCYHLVVLGSQSLCLGFQLLGVEFKLLLLIVLRLQSCVQLLLIALHSLHVPIQFGDEFFFFLSVEAHLLSEFTRSQARTSNSRLQAIALTTQPGDVCLRTASCAIL
jgi:hypothetical protein